MDTRAMNLRLGDAVDFGKDDVRHVSCIAISSEKPQVVKVYYRGYMGLVSYKPTETIHVREYDRKMPEE